MKKVKKVTDHDQRIVAEILIDFLIAYDQDTFWQTWKKIYEQYSLCNDPFTGLPCSSKEAIKNQFEYEKQAMLEKYGHCDGLE